MSRIAVAMSGGVDSSAVAAMLKQQGHEIIGITMRLFEPHCPGPGSAVNDAATVASHLGIPHHIINLETEFTELVINDFINQYRSGQTPNPCIGCNRQIKFGLLLDKARELGAELLATGHYALKTVDPDGTCHLLAARNRAKDQSYFLYSLSQERLSRIIFPLGETASKDEVRRIAESFGLPVSAKKDSQEVCFIPNDDYIAFLENGNSGFGTKGEIIHMDGRIIGRHSGIHRYTIGQRRGLGIAWSEPLYVIAIDAGQNRIVVGEQQHLLKTGLIADDITWIIPSSGNSFETACKIRYRHQPVPCRVESLPANRCRVLFNEPQRSVTPGQFVVFYEKDQVLGGGRIESACETI